MKTVSVAKLARGELSDFKRLIEIFAEVFEAEESISSDEQLSILLANPDFLVFVVKDGQRVLGGLTAYVLHGYFGTKPVAYIYDVGVSPEWQGQGMGKLLIAEIANYCKDSGFDGVYVEAENDDIDAVSFYRKTKYSSEMNVVQFTYSFGNKE